MAFTQQSAPHRCRRPVFAARKHAGRMPPGVHGQAGSHSTPIWGSYFTTAHRWWVPYYLKRSSLNSRGFGIFSDPLAQLDAVSALWGLFGRGVRDQSFDRLQQAGSSSGRRHDRKLAQFDLRDLPDFRFLCIFVHRRRGRMLVCSFAFPIDEPVVSTGLFDMRLEIAAAR